MAGTAWDPDRDWGYEPPGRRAHANRAALAISLAVLTPIIVIVAIGVLLFHSIEGPSFDGTHPVAALNAIHLPARLYVRGSRPTRDGAWSGWGQPTPGWRRTYCSRTDPIEVDEIRRALTQAGIKFARNDDDGLPTLDGVDYRDRVYIDVSLDDIGEPASCIVVRADGYPGDLEPVHR